MTIVITTKDEGSVVGVHHAAHGAFMSLRGGMVVEANMSNSSSMLQQGHDDPYQCQPTGVLTWSKKQSPL